MFVALKRAVLSTCVTHKRLGTFATDTASQLDVLWHDGDTLGVDSAQVGVLEQSYEVCFASLLKSQHSRALESQISLKVLGDFTNKTLEWQFPDQKLGALLVTSDFSESDSSWPVSVGFLHTTSGWGTLASGLGSQLLSWSLSSSGFSSGLLCSCHLRSIT
jgi:hypothetical protein